MHTVDELRRNLAIREKEAQQMARLLDEKRSRCEGLEEDMRQVKHREQQYH